MSPYIPEAERAAYGIGTAVAFCKKCNHWAYRCYCRSCDVFFNVCLCEVPPDREGAAYPLNHAGHRTYPEVPALLLRLADERDLSDDDLL